MTDTASNFGTCDICGHFIERDAYGRWIHAYAVKEHEAVLMKEDEESGQSFWSNPFVSAYFSIAMLLSIVTVPLVMLAFNTWISWTFLILTMIWILVLHPRNWKKR